MSSGTPIDTHRERITAARRTVQPSTVPSPATQKGDPLRVEVVDEAGVVRQSVAASYQQAERIKSRLITALHEQGLRDQASVRIVDVNGVPW